MYQTLTFMFATCFASMREHSKHTKHLFVSRWS